jgi:hypothetical protein
MLFFADGARAGGAFLLDRTVGADAREAINDWVTEVRAGSRLLVTRGPAESSYEAARDASLDSANKALDFLSARGVGDHWIRNADQEHLVWWHDGSASVVRALSVPTLTVAVGPVTVTGGAPVTPPPPQWHESLRYFRLSQTADDLFEAYRNLYLALESVLDTLAPQKLDAKGRPAEGEGQWFKRALTHADSLVNLARFAPPGVADPTENLWGELYRDRRSALFHAKSSRIYMLPHNSKTRHEVAESLKRLTGLYQALAEHVTHLRRSSSGIFAGFWRLQTDGIVDRLRIVATDDPAPFSADEEAINPSGGQLVPLKTATAPEYDRPFERAFLGWVNGQELQLLDRITRICSVIDHDPHSAGIPEGVLRLPRVDRFEVLLKLRAQNANQTKSIFAS